MLTATWRRDEVSWHTKRYHRFTIEPDPRLTLEAVAERAEELLENAVRRRVEHERSGFLVEREDIDVLADGMETLIRQPALRRRMGIEGRIKAEEQFSLTRLVEQTHSVYRAAGWREPGVPAARHKGAA